MRSDFSIKKLIDFVVLFINWFADIRTVIHWAE